MTITQIYELMNTVTGEVLGESAVVQEDLSNVVDLGTQIFDANAVDAYVRSLVNHIGRVIFVNRKYSGNAPSVLMDGWEYGSILEKLSCELPEAEENESWQLNNGTSYDPNIFKAPTISAKFFNKRVTFEIDMSFTELQIKQSFSNAEQLNGFISMIYNAIDRSMTVKMDALIMRTINNMIGETLYADIPDAAYTTKTGVKAVNLLKLYNDKFDKSLTAEECCTDADFCKFAAYTMGMYENRMSKLSTLFNIGGKDRFTPADMLHVILIADLANGAAAYLQSDTYHNEFVALPRAEVVPYWQGSGTDYGFEDVSSINIKTASNHSIEISGVLGVMFDRDALGVTNLDRRVTTNYNPKGEFFNNFYKFEAGYFNDTNENFVVFFAA